MALTGNLQRFVYRVFLVIAHVTEILLLAHTQTADIAAVLEHVA